MEGAKSRAGRFPGGAAVGMTDLAALRRDLDRLARRLALLEEEQEQRRQTEAWILADSAADPGELFDLCFGGHRA